MSLRYDLRSGLIGAISNKPGGGSLSGAAALSGSGVDCDLQEGQVYGEVSVGDALGSPTSFSATGKLQEADDNSGTNAQDIAGQTNAIVTANASRAMASGQRTKRYVRVVVTPVFSGGSTPSLPFSSSVLGVARRVNNLQT